MSRQEICDDFSEAADNAVRKTMKMLERMKGGFISSLIKSEEVTMTICEKISNLCKKQASTAYTKKNEAIAKLGAEVWALYQDKVFKSIFQQDNVKKLIEELEVYEKEVREIEEKILAEKKEKERREKLRKAVSDIRSDDPRVKRSAIRVMEKIGGKEAIPYLNEVLDDPVSEVRESAARVLHKLVNDVARDTKTSGNVKENKPAEKETQEATKEEVEDTEEAAEEKEKPEENK